jgi:hypothetical protein
MEQICIAWIVKRKKLGRVEQVLGSRYKFSCVSLID